VVGITENPLNGNGHDSFLARHGATVAFLISIVIAIGSAAYVSVNDAEQDEQIARGAARSIAAIEASRIDLALRGCKDRNVERRVDRREIRDDLRNLRAIPPGGLEALGLTRAMVRASKVRHLKALRPLDCEAQADAIRESSPAPIAPLE
jgi:hypothetical protein